LEAEKTAHLVLADGVAEAPDAHRRDEDHQLHEGRRQVHDHRRQLLGAEDERCERPFYQEERGEADARNEAPLATPRDEICNERVEYREDIGDLCEVLVLPREPRWSAGIDAVEDAVHHEED
jgi:hypothetical protein